MSELRSIIRQWRLLQLLAGARVDYTVQELAVSIKTVRRDLEDLSAAGFRVRETVGHRGAKRWRVEGFEESFGFTITDLMSIYPQLRTPFQRQRLHERTK